jgi:hypothetical protein
VRLVLIFAVALAGCAGPRQAPDEPPDAIFVPPTHRERDRIVMPLTFPDGTRVTLTYPPELAVAELGATPYGSGYLERDDGEVGRDLLVLYESDGEDHVPNALRLEFGRWTVEIYDHASPPAAMTEAERRAFAAGLHGRETADGFLILEATPPLRLATANEHAGPALEFGMSKRPPWLQLALAECGPKAESTSRGFSSWCLSDSIVAHAYGGRRFRAAAAEGIELR